METAKKLIHMSRKKKKKYKKFRKKFDEALSKSTIPENYILIDTEICLFKEVTTRKTIPNVRNF